MTGDPSEDQLPEALTFEVELKEMERTAVAQAKVVLKGDDAQPGPPATYVTVHLSTLPHKARAMPFASKWRMTLERID